jgi:integrase
MRRNAAERYPDLADFILFLGSLGWRWSEAAALSVRDVYDDGDHVWVDVTRVFRVVKGRQVLVEGAAKSYAGFRRSRVPSEAGAMLRRRVVGRAPSDYVFTNSRGNHWNQNTFLRETWPTLLAASGVGGENRRPTPHWLRHMAGANMARAGIPMHEIQRIIGHEDVRTTNSIYGGMVSTLSAASIPVLDAVLAGQEPQVIAGVVIRG